jgi:hypothetical protein
MSAGSKVEDDKQDYALSMMGPSYISPSGQELAFYETEDNERLVVKHATGSSIEFMSDGSVFIKAIKDLHMHGSVLSDQSGSFESSAKGADSTTMRYDTDLTLEVGGRLNIKCAQLDLEVGNSAFIKAGRDIKMEQNNLITKSAEQTAIEATKSVYIDTKELKERLTSRRAEIGSEESPGGLSGGGFAPVGGVNVINVTGNTIIENNNPSGGITISSAGYLNLVAGGERVDITGKWAPMSTGPSPTFFPSMLAKPFLSTFTNLVFDPIQGLPDPKMQYNAPPGTGGSYCHMSQNSSVYHYATTNMNAPMAAGNGHLVNVLMGNKTENVIGNRFRSVLMNEFVTVAGMQKIQAAIILLN